MQDIVSIWYVVARKLCLVVDSQVKIWSFTLSYKNCYLTLLCLQHNFVTILTIFAKFKYKIDLNKLAITLQPSKNEELCPFPILIEKHRVLQLLLCEKSQSSCRYFHVFPYQNLICYFSIWWKEQHQQLITYYKLIELFLANFLINVTKNCHFWSDSNSFFFLNMWHVSRTAIKFIFWFWRWKIDTRLYSCTSCHRLAEGCYSWYYEVQVYISFTLYFTYNITNDITIHTYIRQCYITVQWIYESRH